MSTPAVQFKQDARRLSADLRHRRIIQTAMGNYEVARDQRKAAFQDWQGARQMAAETKWEAVNHLDRHLEQFREVEARGAKVHWAGTGQQARDLILGILRAKNARVVVKSKAMTSEEIHLNATARRRRATPVSKGTGSAPRRTWRSSHAAGG